MSLQNRLALDMLLLKEQGVCRLLNLSETECCITIHNASPSIEEARAKMKETSDSAGELFQFMQPRDWFSGLEPGSWVTTLLKSSRLTGWGKWLAQVGLGNVMKFVFIIVLNMITCLLILLPPLFTIFILPAWEKTTSMFLRKCRTTGQNVVNE